MVGSNQMDGAIEAMEAIEAIEAMEAMKEEVFLHVVTVVGPSFLWDSTFLFGLLVLFLCSFVWESSLCGTSTSCRER